MEVVAIDIGGTHARFAIATCDAGRIALGPETVLGTSDFPGLAEAWRAYGERAGRPLPRAAAIAVAGPVVGGVARTTNNRWELNSVDLAAKLNVSDVVLLNDFAAVGHAVPACRHSLTHICGPDLPLPDEGVVSIIGPGTGLGVGILHRTRDEDIVIATEGGHIGFAPCDALEDRILARLRARYGRVSIERVVCGAGLPEIHAAITGAAEPLETRALWALALSGDDSAAAEALDRFCGLLGAAAGDLALAHGASAVVVAGGLGLRIANHLPRSAFVRRFSDKGRFAHLLAGLPVKLITHPQPGLVGAAAAFAAEHDAQKKGPAPGGVEPGPVSGSRSTAGG